MLNASSMIGSRVPAAAMANLLGDLWKDDCQQPPDWSQALAVDGVNLHLYGKQVAKPGRKMGHLTATAANAVDAVRRVREAREVLNS